MHPHQFRLRTGAATALLCTIFLLATPAPQAVTDRAAVSTSAIFLTLEAAGSTIHWTLDSTLHTVHGTFALKNGSLRFDPKTGAAGGEIVVSAFSGESGNGSRDGRMHREILETAKYPDAVFHPKQVEGAVATSGASDVKLRGILSIHGSDHDITTQVHVEITGNRWSGNSRFDIPYVQWGIKDPSNFLLKVKPVVNVEVEMTGTVASAK
jgi:polyisoprenoid-binding protein YceI